MDKKGNSSEFKEKVHFSNCSLMEKSLWKSLQKWKFSFLIFLYLEEISCFWHVAFQEYCMMNITAIGIIEYNFILNREIKIF